MVTRTSRRAVRRHVPLAGADAPPEHAVCAAVWAAKLNEWPRLALVRSGLQVLLIGGASAAIGYLIGIGVAV
jgi:hypothetical protein